MQGTLTQDRRFTSVAYLTTFIALVYLLINLLKVGGENVVYSVNTYAESAFSILNAIACIWLWSRSGKDDLSKRIWGYFALGMATWGIAEIFWTIFALGWIQAPPFPSVADIFYFLGYFPLFFALYLRFRTLRVHPTRRQWTTAILLSIPVVAAVIYFILAPIFMDLASERLIEAVLNVFYPLADMALMFVALFILFIISEGKYSIAWQLITAGLFLTAVGDLLFTYADGKGIYYPDGHLNWISILVDYPYNVSYLVIAIGVVTYRVVDTNRNLQAVRIDTTSLDDVNCEMLLFTDKQNRVISCSDNLSRLAKVRYKLELIGNPLGRVLGIDDQAAGELLGEVATAGYINHREIEMRDRQGQPHRVWMTALAVQGMDNAFEGTNIVLQAFVENKIDNDLSTESQLLVKHMLIKAGVIGRENRQILISYFKAQIEALYNLVDTLGGKKTALAMVALLGDTARQNGWPIEFESPEVSIQEGAEIGKLGEACLGLLRKARSFAADVTSLGMVREVMGKVDSQLSPDQQKIVDSFGLRNL